MESLLRLSPFFLVALSCFQLFAIVYYLTKNYQIQTSSYQKIYLTNARNGCTLAIEDSRVSVHAELVEARKLFLQ